jgi:methylated-DNA-[protein]-cysteine S-methyltransferase
VPQLSVHSPVGALTVSEESGRIVAVDWGWGRDQTASALLLDAREQLHAYFDGRLRRFELPLDPGGTAYQRRVWDEVASIPFGGTAAYGIVAAKVGGSARAIGQANARNRLPILIPCHRVVGTGGIGGYSGGDGVEIKRYLLGHERRFVTTSP